MGCGASVDRAGREPRSKRGKRIAEPQAPVPQPHQPEAEHAAADGIVTPTGSTREPPEIAPEGLQRPPGRQALRIETTPVATSRRDVGLAVTPVGKQAEEFKFFCPVCMMFFRSILEIDCCKQSICSFCLTEHVSKRMQLGGVAAPPATDGVYRKPMLPAGIPCPQCAQVQKGRAQTLRTVEGLDEVRVPYVTSPSTSQHLEEISSRREHSNGALSPLKVGDDFQTMARKMLPFDVGESVVEEADSVPATPEDAPRPPEGMEAFSRDEGLSASTGRLPALEDLLDDEPGAAPAEGPAAAVWPAAAEGGADLAVTDVIGDGMDPDADAHVIAPGAERGAATAVHGGGIGAEEPATRGAAVRAVAESAESAVAAGVEVVGSDRER